MSSGSGSEGDSPQVKSTKELCVRDFTAGFSFVYWEMEG